MTTTSPSLTEEMPLIPTTSQQRLQSLDVLRGLTIAFMILVNNNGNEAVAYRPLKHAAWNGFTPTDLVFPTFLFLVGISTVFSIISRRAQGAAWQSIFLHVLRRAMILYILGIVVNSFPFFHLSTMRFYGVLPRIVQDVDFQVFEESMIRSNLDSKCPWSILLMVVLVVAVTHCAAEEILLKDGTKITGTVIGVSADKFQIKTQYGEMSVPKSDVVQISFPENKPKDAVPAAGAAKEPIKVDDDLKGTTYTNRTVKFTVEVPKGWVRAPEMWSHSIAGALKSADESQIFMVTPEKFDGTLKTFKVMADAQFQSTFGDYKKLQESETMLDGQPAARMVIQGKVKAANDMPMRMLVYIMPSDGRMVRLSFLTLDPLFEDSLPVFEKIAASYKTLK